jgi:Flp pilus assembly protein TadG
MVEKAQASVEFVLVFSLLTIFITLFLAVVYANMREAKVKDDQEIADDMATFIQQELVLASKVEDGYNRTIFLPEKASGKLYNISIFDYYLTVNTTHAVSFRGSPKVTSLSGKFFEIGKNNTIIKNFSGIFVN